MTEAPYVRDLMTRRPVVCKLRDTTRRALELMESYHIGSVIVVDEAENIPLNIITRRDVLSAIYHNKLDDSIEELIELLEKDALITVREDETIIEAIRLLEEKGIEHLPVIDSGGNLVGILTGTDILRGISKLALVDPLTGLENRRILQILSRKLNTKRARDIFIMIVDIDNFKRINDTYGHALGDEVLRRTAREILLSVRSYDNVIRYGGDEFLVVMYRLDEKNALEIGNRIKQKVEAVSFEQHPELSVSVSIGIAPYSSDLFGSIEKADEALYRAKKEGKNRVVLLR